MNSLPPVFTPSIFNTNAFQGTIYITKEDADRLYLSINAGKNLGLIDGITPGTVAASKAVIVDSSSNITGFNNITLNGNLTASTSIVTPIINANSYLLAGSSVLMSSLISNTPGAIVANKALVFDSNAAITGAISLSNNLGDMLVLTSTLSSSRNTIKFVTDTQTFEIGSRGSTSTNASNFYIYNGNYRFLMNPSGDISVLSTTDSSSSTTGCMKISGGVGIAKNCNIDGILTLNRAGSQLSINNGANNGLIEVSSSPNTLRLVNGTALNISSGGLTVASASTAAARYNLDMQASVADIKLCLYQNGSNGTYGFGASGSALNVITGGSSIKFYKTSTGGSLGTNTATIDTDGNFDAINNILAGTGLVAKRGFSASGRSGRLAVLHLANDIYSELFTYNYNTGSFLDILIGDTLLVQGGVKNVGIGISNPSSDIIAYPFVVNKTISSSISGAYGYLAQTGSGTGTNTGSVGVSAFFSGRLFCTEVDCYSDLRKKKHVEKIDPLKADEFIEKVEPVEFEWKDGQAGKRTGYIAQQILKTGLFKDLVTFHKDDTMMGDDDSPDCYSLSVQYNNVVAILHQAIKNQNKKIESQQLEINNLNYQISYLLEYNDHNNREIEDLNKRLNEVVDYINEE